MADDGLIAAPTSALESRVLEEFDGDPLAWDLLQCIRSADAAHRERLSELLCAARGAAGWRVRCLACALLEAALLRVAADDTATHFELLRELGLLRRDGGGWQLDAEVSRLGFTATDPADFVGQFRQRLTRFAPLYCALSARRLSVASVSSLGELCRQECRLFLTRFLLSPAEVVARIEAQTRATRGEMNERVMRSHDLERSLDAALAELPRFEREILARLTASRSIHWVSDLTSSRLLRLVEYPRGTAALVVKPPGSDLEFEIKRAGLRGSWPLRIVFKRKGRRVPPSHRLWGGDMIYFLRWEAHNAAWIALLHRALTGRPAPIAHMVQAANMREVPGAEGPVDIITYLSGKTAYGRGYKKMRRAMKRAIVAFGKERDWYGQKRAGARGTTMQFLDTVFPGQGILLGSSSLRLDRLAADLAPGGARDYLDATGARRAETHDGRVFADALLDEVFDRYRPPDTRYRSHRRYIDAVFAVAENRAAADRCFLSAMRQAGRYWAIFLAVRSHTRGESFAARNVGLRKVWAEGRWQVALRFMDNDDVQTIGNRLQFFWPANVLRGMNMDRAHLLGGQIGPVETAGCAGCLEDIYRADEELRREGHAAFLAALRRDYRAAKQRLQDHAEARAYLSESFADTLGDWDKVLTWYFEDRAARRPDGHWQDRARRHLAARDYPDRLIGDYLAVVQRYPEMTEIFREIIAPDTAA